QHVHRPEVSFDLLQTREAGVVARHVPLVDVDAGLALELRGGFVVTGMARRHLVAGRFERNRDRLTDASRSAGYHRNSGHRLLLILIGWSCIPSALGEPLPFADGLCRPCLAPVGMTGPARLPSVRPSKRRPCR